MYKKKGLSKEKSSRYLHWVVINGSILIDIPIKHKLLVSQSSHFTFLFCYSQVSRLEKLQVLIPARCAGEKVTGIFTFRNINMHLVVLETQQFVHVSSSLSNIYCTSYHHIVFLIIILPHCTRRECFQFDSARYSSFLSLY